MLVVLADDFSGAAEIGGIGHRYGLGTEIQLQFDPSSTADLVVVDTDTRSLNEVKAIRKMEEVSLDLKKSNKPVRLFKKIDSVMRGHLIPELNVLQNHFQYNRILLLPANPGRGRKIIGGKYFVKGTSLEKTVFADDPDFPMVSASVLEIINSKSSNLNPIHIQPGDSFPSSSLITGDVESKSDLKEYLTSTNQYDLCCGAAELFESYLENLGYAANGKTSRSDDFKSPPFVLIINGSTVKNLQEKELYKKLNIPQLVFPGEFQGNQFKLEKEDSWYHKVLNYLNEHRVVVISIEHRVQHDKTLSEIFLKHFIGMMHYITSHIDMKDIHFCLTGGATASAIIRNSTSGKLKVKREIASGVVTLARRRNDSEQEFFTVKPGSYPWPASFIEGLSASRK